MKITILGASAGVGLNAVGTALQRGHQVTALHVAPPLIRSVLI